MFYDSAHPEYLEETGSYRQKVERGAMGGREEWKLEFDGWRV